MIITLADINESTSDSCREHGTDHSKCIMKNGNCTCKAEKNITTAPECHYVSERIKFLFNNVTPGNYCVKIKVDDDRCVRSSSLQSNSSCILWKRIVNNKEEDDVSDVNINPISGIAISLVGIVSFLVLSFAVMLLWLFKKKSIWATPEFPPDEVLPMVSKKKVLLLYPRDCDHFMTAMKTFGRLLEKSCSIEVFDCYHNEEVWNEPVDWVQSKLRNSQFSIIIVTSHCAYLHQEAILSEHIDTSQYLYRDPSFLDKIFIYGLKFIMKDISPDAYSRNFVIGYNGFSDDTHLLSLPTRFRRYIIPNHLQSLLSDMNINYNLQNTVEYVTLESNIRSLKEYKSINPNYLKKMLKLI